MRKGRIGVVEEDGEQRQARVLDQYLGIAETLRV